VSSDKFFPNAYLGSREKDKGTFNITQPSELIRRKLEALIHSLPLALSLLSWLGFLAALALSCVAPRARRAVEQAEKERVKSTRKTREASQKKNTRKK